MYQVFKLLLPLCTITCPVSPIHLGTCLFTLYMLLPKRLHLPGTPLWPVLWQQAHCGLPPPLSQLSIYLSPSPSLRLPPPSSMYCPQVAYYHFREEDKMRPDSSEVPSGTHTTESGVGGGA